jgi:hypothetical protein
LKNYAGFLKLNGTFLDTLNTNDETEFEIWKVQPSRKDLVDKRKIGPGVISTDNIDKNGITKIRVTGSLNFDLNLFYEEPEVSYDVTFFNDCKGAGCTHVSDFKHYYKIIDTSNLKAMFEITTPEGTMGDENGTCSPGSGINILVPESIEGIIA